MKSIADKLFDLSEVYGADGDLEHTLHEVCHVVVLGMPSMMDDLALLEDGIAHECRWMRDYCSDWHEIKTIACEVVVFNRFPSLSDDRLNIEEIAINAQFKCLSRNEVIKHVERLAKTKVAKKRAQQAVKLIDARWKKLQEEQRR